MAKFKIEYPDENMKAEQVPEYVRYLVTELEYQLTHIDNNNLSKGYSLTNNDSEDK